MIHRTNQLKCTRCGRYNWSENPRCAWCNKPLTESMSRGMVLLVALVSIGSMVSVAVAILEIM